MKFFIYFIKNFHSMPEPGFITYFDGILKNKFFCIQTMHLKISHLA